jgi:hypothetical protein
MGIDLYVCRENSTVDIPKSLTQAPTQVQAVQQQPKPAAPAPKVVSLDELTQIPWIADLCLVFDMTSKDIKAQSDNVFGFAQLSWQFEPKGQEPTLKGNQLQTGLLDGLATPSAKKALWGCICQHLDQLTAAKNRK